MEKFYLHLKVKYAFTAPIFMKLELICQIL